MKKTIPIVAMFSLLLSSLALASSHREAPTISTDPSADNTDLYAWVSGNRLVVIANYIPLQEPSGGPNFHQFSDDVRYEIHIAKGASLDDYATYFVEFTSTGFPRVDPANLALPPGGGKEFFSQLAGNTQTYSVTRIRGASTRIGNNLSVAPPNIGPRTNAVVYGTDAYDDAFVAQFIHTLNDGTRVFAGPRDDGFYVDLGGIFDLANIRGEGEAQDGVSGFNVHSIALEIPLTVLFPEGVPNTPGNQASLGVWAAASRRKVSVRLNNGRMENAGPWVQVSRLGLPLVNEALIGLQDKDKYNATHPKNDVANFAAYFLNPVVVRDAEAVGIYAALGVPQGTVDALKSNRTDILDIITLRDFPTQGAHDLPVADMLRVDVAAPQGFPNGRTIAGGTDQEGADVTDVLLTVLLSGGALAISDGVSRNDKVFLSTFPYLAHPHEGRSEGHGAIPGP